MARRRKKKGRSATKRTRPAGATAASTQNGTPSPDATTVVERAEEVAQREDIRMAAPEPLTPADTPATPALAIKLRALVETFDKELTSLRAKEEQLAGKRQALAEQQKTLQSDREEHERHAASLAEARSALREREEDIERRESAADAGFIDRWDEVVEACHVSRDSVFARIQERSEEVAAEHARRYESIHEKLRERELELDDREQKLLAFERDVKRLKRDAENADADAEDLRACVESHIERAVSQQVAEKELELERSQAAVERLHAAVGELEEKLEARDRAARMLEHMSPEAVRRRIDTLQARCEELEAELANSPTPEEAQELLALRAEKSEWTAARRSLTAERGRLQTRLDTLLVEVDSHQALRDRNEALRSSQTLLKAALDDLRTDLEQRLDKHRDQPVYPELVRISESRKFNNRPERLFPSGSASLDLARFAEDLVHRLGRGNDDQPDLYFRARDVRAFVGGLAMSRLHLLQGISGIGKSSLPRAFASAIGGFCDTISVQAGWRDRNDLLGYYNAFERRYYESPFVQALYKAGTPSWSDRVVIVLLDEMNLSHPEQYGADVLDVLERTQRAKRRFELMTFQPTGQVPARLPEGRYLPLPSNVWFVGTANHDETTKDFADKTYDRSFVLELPSKPEAIELRRLDRLPPLSAKALTAAFDDAVECHRSEASAAWSWIEHHLRDPMLKRFGVGLGGRLETQSSRFVSVVLAAGGDVGEALDQLVSTRVLRKVRKRHDTMEEDLEFLRRTVTENWPQSGTRPEACVALLDEELRTKRG